MIMFLKISKAKSYLMHTFADDGNLSAELKINNNMVSFVC